MKENNPFKSIGVDYIHIFEMWAILNNIERFTIDWETEDLLLKYYYMYYKYEWKKQGKSNNKKLLHVIFEILLKIKPELHNKYIDALYYN